ncbi:MAG: ABC transporter substrate-binding protein [Chloroflexi bacterium]|nr:ABC transporter substrate-binding protein [Chloroflexota bacterium]
MGRYLRWQAAIALLGVVLLAALLRYAAYNFTTVTVPDRGGTYVEGIAGNPQYLNPLLSQFNQVDGVLVTLLFNGLTRLDEQGNVVPDLAEAWNASSDGLTYDFRLRPGLSWHDGAAVTAADVLYTVGAMQAEDFPGLADLGVLWRAVQTTAPDGPDGLVVRFTLKQPLASFPDYTTIGLLPAHLWERVPTAAMLDSQLNTRPVGTGPFQLVQISATRAELAANPRYHGPTPYLTGLSFRFYPDRQSLLPAFDRGEIDGISFVAPDDLAEANKRKDLQLFSAPLSGYTLIYLNQQNPNTPFFQETAVRQALLLALDRQALVDQTLHGQGIVAHTPFLPGTWAYDAEVPQYGYDPDRARRLLDEAGWQDRDGDGVRDHENRKLAFILVGNDRAMIEAIATAWTAIGVQAAAEPVSLAGLTSDLLTPRSFDAALVHWELSGDPDPYPLWHSTQIKDGQNYSGWSLRTTDEAIERARAVSDPAMRRSYYVMFQRAFAAEVPALLLYYPVYTYGVRTKVHDVQISPLNTPADRFRGIANWYIVTKRITVGSQKQ